MKVSCALPGGTASSVVEKRSANTPGASEESVVTMSNDGVAAEKLVIQAGGEAMVE